MRNMATKPDQTTDAEQNLPGDPNMSGSGATLPVPERTSPAFRRDYANSQVIQPGYDAVDTCDNDRYAGYPTPEPVRRP